jgi:Zn-dependent protease with chaperone function
MSHRNLGSDARDRSNRWANIILGVVFAGFALIFGPIAFLAEPSAYVAYVILIGIAQFVATALIVWYAWKSEHKA